MRARRIARRVASMTGPQNPWLGAVNAPTLARKVFHYPFHPFSPPRGGRLAVELDGAWSSTGVKQRLGRGGARRVEWQERPAVTPFITDVLVTKGKYGGVA